MKRLLPLLALAALAACHQTNTADDAANNAAAMAAPPVELPPAIRSQKTYRCSDGSLAYVNWFVGDKQANVHLTENGAPTVLNSETSGSPWKSADGKWTLSGTDTNITLVEPAKGSHTCHT